MTGVFVGRALCAWAGVLGVALPVIGLFVFPIWDFPGTTTSGTGVVAFVHGHRHSLQWLMVLNTVGVSLWLVFGAATWGRLRRVTSDGDPLPVCFAMGVAGFVLLLLAGFTCFDVLVLRVPDASGASMLYDLTFGLLAMSGLPTAIALGAYAWVNAQYRLLPQVTSILAFLAGGAHLFLLASFVVPTGFFSLEGQVITMVPGLLFVWIFITAVAMLRGESLRDQAATDERAFAP